MASYKKGSDAERHLRNIFGMNSRKDDNIYIEIGEQTGPVEKKKEMKIFCELIFRLQEFRPYGMYLTLVQFGCYIGFGLLEMCLTGDRTRKIPIKMYGMLAFLSVATMGLSNTSVGYLNYPTQVIFKCCKLIPVMIGGILIQGVVLISLALCADGAIGNFQEKVLKQYTAGNSEMVFYSYAIGFVYILIGVTLSGELVPAFKVCQKYPLETYGYGALFSLTGYVGLYIVLTLVRSFGALVAVTVTTCRKAVTVILSFLFFTKPFTYQYLWSGLLVVLGIYLNIYSKNRASWDTSIAQWLLRVKQLVGLETRHTIPSLSGSV
ncbi:S35B3-like protein, partial [Mya arenaria]